MKKIIKIIVPLIVILTCTIIILNIISGKEKIQNTVENHGNNTIDNDEKYTIKEDKDAFFTVENIVQKYVDKINEKDSKAVYSMFSKSYINNNNINIENTFEYSTDLNEGIKFWATDIRLLEKTNDIDSYCIYGFVSNSEKKVEKFILLEVIMDKNNQTFSIVPQNKDDINEIVASKQKEMIEGNLYNKYERISADDETVVNKYMQYYRYNIICNPERAYDLLDQEYSKQKFGSIEGYKKYLESIDIYNSIKINKYQTNTYDEYTQYVCVDQYDNYYIFNETKSMKYTVILDTYTIDIPQFTEKYENAISQEKVALNIQKIIEAINDKDYKYVYSKLSSGFVENYDITEETLGIYLQDFWFKENAVKYIEFTEEGNDLYSYTIELTDATGEIEESITKTFILKLNGITDFEYSFNVN